MPESEILPSSELPRLVNECPPVDPSPPLCISSLASITAWRIWGSTHKHIHETGNEAWRLFLYLGLRLSAISKCVIAAILDLFSLTTETIPGQSEGWRETMGENACRVGRVCGNSFVLSENWCRQSAFLSFQLGESDGQPLARYLTTIHSAASIHD